MEKEWRNLLIRSLEEPLSMEESNRLKNALQKSPELRKEQEELQALRQLLASFSVAKSDAFVDKTMQIIQQKRINGDEKINQFLIAIFPKAAAACVLLLATFMLYILFSEGSLDTETLVGLNDLTPEEAYSFLIDE